MIQVMESKTIDNKDIQNINHMINHPDNHQSYTNELMRYTVTQELQETEWPMPSPVPERFTQMHKQQRHIEFEKMLPLRDDIEEGDCIKLPEDETNWNIHDEAANNLSNKMPTPIERQSITNSNIFRMSDNAFKSFDMNQEIGEFIEVTDEELCPPPNQDYY